MSLIRNLSLSRRLLVGFGLVLSLLALTTLLSVYTMRDTRARLTVVSEELSPIVALVSQMKEQANQAAVSMRNFALLDNGEELKQEFRRLAGAYKTYETLAQELSERVGRSRIAPEEEMALVKKMAAAQLAATADFEGAKAKAGPSGTVEDMAVLVRIELRTNMAQWGKAQAAWLAAITEMEQQQAQTIQTYQAAVVQQVTRGQLVALVVATAALVAGLVASLTITRSVVRPVGEAMQVADRMAEGDLSQPIAISHRDELGQLQQRLEAMRLRWAETLLQLRHATDGVGTASTEIAAGNHDLSQRTEHAASRLQEVTASMHTLTLNVQQSADAAREADQLAGSAAQVAERGGEVVSRVVAAMTEIDASAQRIAEIISVIDGIAFQTNILALNAAVEAARAGEHGRGFAVVAGEVRALAQRAAVAAKEIKSLIGTSVEQVQSGSRHVEEAGSTMRDIVGSVQRVTQIIGDIAEAAKAQSQGISHVNGSVVHLDQSTQQNAALVEQSAAASESLKEQAQRLTEAIRAFKVA